jgi:hypothetical protein
MSRKKIATSLVRGGYFFVAVSGIEKALAGDR